ncbi:hypothetical protein KC19_2G051100 [Ceratodon purpureus]|uniref:Uncharacterized protein n=1 Tax=Ceratodon purpureus TaxID=3225 RepID=A0A8T0IQC2_CERPU|nr:hypothetical protein KC19_2G051100 [Ceratodon purpureus]
MCNGTLAVFVVLFSLLLERPRRFSSIYVFTIYGPLVLLEPMNTPAHNHVLIEADPTV